MSLVESKLSETEYLSNRKKGLPMSAGDLAFFLHVLIVRLADQCSNGFSDILQHFDNIPDTTPKFEASLLLLTTALPTEVFKKHFLFKGTFPPFSKFLQGRFTPPPANGR